MLRRLSTLKSRLRRATPLWKNHIMGKKYEALPQQEAGASSGNGSPPSYHYPTLPAQEFSPKRKDKWATILFVLHLASIAVISGLGYNEMMKSGKLPFYFQPSSEPSSEFSAKDFMLPIFTSLATGLLLTIIYFSMVFLSFLIMQMQRMAGKLIWTSFLLNIGASLAIAALGLFSGSFIIGI